MPSVSIQDPNYSSPYGSHASTPPVSYPTSSYSESGPSRPRQQSGPFHQAQSPLDGPQMENIPQRRGSLLPRERTTGSRHRSLSPRRNTPQSGLLFAPSSESPSRQGSSADRAAPSPSHIQYQSPWGPNRNETARRFQHTATPGHFGNISQDTQVDPALRLGLSPFETQEPQVVMIERNDQSSCSTSLSSESRNDQTATRRADPLERYYGIEESE